MGQVTTDDGRGQFGFVEDDENTIALKDSDFITQPGDVPVRSATERDAAREGAVIDVMSQMHPDSIVRVLVAVARKLPMPMRFNVATEIACALDFEHIGRLTREGFLMLKRACVKYRVALREGRAAESALERVAEVLRQEVTSQEAAE